MPVQNDGTSSDPFDDDDIFSDPQALSAIAALEERAIASSQAIKKSGGFHHTVVRPNTGPRSAVASGPAPLNTNPRVNKCGFGWEPGGKFQAKVAAGLPIAQPLAHLDEEPMDVIMDERGRYGFGDEEIIDQRTRPEIRQLVESAGRPEMPGSQARRAAIADALPPRQPMQRSTSAGPSQPLFQPRKFTRSVSTGSQVFGAARPAGAKPSALPPIPSQGSQPASQGGAAARRAIFELEEERRRREASEAKVEELLARLAAAEAIRPPWRDEVDEGQDAQATVQELKQQLWTAQGQAETARRNQEASEARYLAELDKMRTSFRDMEAQMRVRDQEAKQKIESMKTQAVFSNHNALASASKARQQSQWTASQRGAPTPIKGGSPLRDKSAVTPAPLMRSAKGKSRAALPPRFDSLHNAFNITPTVSAKKRPRSDQSPTTTPRKRHATSSPVVSPLHNQIARPGTPGAQEIESMDWQPDFTAAIEPVVLERDPRAELLYHILNHVASSPMQLGLKNLSVTTVSRISSREVHGGLQIGDVLGWKETCGELLRLCGASNRPFEDLCGEFMRIFARLTTQALLYNRKSTVPLTDLIINVVQLFSSTALRFPNLVASDTTAASELCSSLSELVGELTSGDAAVSTARWQTSFNSWPEPLGPSGVERELVYAVVEAAEAICLSDGKCVWSAQLAEIILGLLDYKPFALPGLLDHTPNTMLRALDLFATAACRKDHFRVLHFAPDKYGQGVPVIDAVARKILAMESRMGAEAERIGIEKPILQTLSALMVLSRAHEDALPLMTEESVLIPALVILIHREASRSWSVDVSEPMSYRALDFLSPAIILLHHLVFPPPFPPTNQSQAGDVEADSLFSAAPPRGVDLARRLHEAGSSNEFNGVQHVFVSALGAIAYADVDLDGPWINPPPDEDDSRQSDKDPTWPHDLRTVQFLAQDLLDAVVEGPEGDNVYELYGEEEAIEIEEEGEEDYDEEERLMEAWE